jgi:hypothetical protein
MGGISSWFKKKFIVSNPQEKGILINLDMENTFKRVRHNFLFALMEKCGFSRKISVGSNSA